MLTYTINCANGYRQNIKAKSLIGAKRQATKICAIFGVGSFTVTTPEGAIYRREFWSVGNYFGWHKWAKVN